MFFLPSAQAVGTDGSRESKGTEDFSSMSQHPPPSVRGLLLLRYVRTQGSLAGMGGDDIS